MREHAHACQCECAVLHAACENHLQTWPETTWDKYILTFAFAFLLFGSFFPLEICRNCLRFGCLTQLNPQPFFDSLSVSLECWLSNCICPELYNILALTSFAVPFSVNYALSGATKKPKQNRTERNAVPQLQIRLWAAFPCVWLCVYVLVSVCLSIV